MEDENKFKIEKQEKNILFQKLYAKYQKNIRTIDEYIKYEAYIDLKIIFDLYGEVYHLKSYNYNNITIENLKKLVKPFDCFRKKELLEYLLKNLVQNGYTSEAKSLISYINQLEIECSFVNLKNGKEILKSILKIVHYTAAYNLYTLLISVIVFLIISCIFYSSTPINWMQIIEIEKTQISDNTTFNHFLNVIGYIFNFDNTMSIKPLNWRGLLLMVFGKSIFIVVIINYVVKELLDRLKFS